MNNALVQVRVASKQIVATDICMVELVGVDDSTLPGFSPGSHIDVHLKPGLVRQYSLCNDSRDANRYVIAVLREPDSRGGSIAVHESLQTGQLLNISAPRNLFPLGPTDVPSILFAGGIGVTPILSMVRALSQCNATFTFHYCARTRSRMAFADEIENATFAGNVRLYLDDERGSPGLDVAAVLASASPLAHLYVCGPAGFIRAVTDAAASAGWPPSQVHLEYFSAAPDAEIDGSAAESGFEVHAARSGKVVQVGANETIVTALARAGVMVETSCEQGICGTCMTKVLDGEPDHRDLNLSEADRMENKLFLPCCSRSLSPVLVLDL